MQNTDISKNNCVENPLSPCAMIGACAILTGFSGLDVVIHGASGCYYYPKSIIKKQLYSTLLIESEIVLGTSERLRSLISDLKSTGNPVAVVNTCIPAITGENHSTALDGTDGFFVDAPGFIGNAETGVKKAYDALNIQVTNREGINIDGICSLDLFSRGNLHEIQRILSILNIPVALTLASDSFRNLRKGAAPFTLSANPSWNSGIGENIGSFLFSDLKNTIKNMEKIFSGADFNKIEKEIDVADEQMYYYADKYLRKYSPPVAAIISQKSYCDFAAWMLKRYLDSDIPLILPREEETDYTTINRKLTEVEPDLILGSTFESYSHKNAAFFGLTYPDRSRISLAAHPITGIEGAMYLLENVLNASIDFKNTKN